jgi:predicted DsbA family dithiol-disulfide isomerase
LNEFHTRHQDIAVLVNVHRHPYSFIGDSKRNSSLAGRGTPQGKEPTWHDSLLGYCGGREEVRTQAEEGMRTLAHTCGIEFDYNVQTNWQPVNSQRVMLWAHRFGLQEAYMSALAHRHFEQRKSASHDCTILECVEEVGLDVDACRTFLETDELRADVWNSYGSTIHEKGIHSIPLFIFNSPATDGGPFRNGKGRPEVEHGSGSKERFLQIFESLLRASQPKLASM